MGREMFTQHIFGSSSKCLGTTNLGHSFILCEQHRQVNVTAFSIGCYCAPAPNIVHMYWRQGQINHWKNWANAQGIAKIIARKS